MCCAAGPSVCCYHVTTINSRWRPSGTSCPAAALCLDAEMLPGLEGGHHDAVWTPGHPPDAKARGGQRR